MKNKFEEGFIWTFNELKASCADYVGLGKSLTGFYLKTFTGLSFKLEDYSTWSFTAAEYTKVKIKIGALTIDVESSTFIRAACATNPAMLALGLLGDQPYPGSETWYFIRNGQSIKKGSEYDPVEKYYISDSLIDGSLFLLAVSILYGLFKCGLWLLAKIFAKRVLTNNTINETSVAQMVEDIKEVVDDNLDTTVSSRADKTTNDAVKSDTTQLKLDVAKILSEFIEEGGSLESKLDQAIEKLNNIRDEIGEGVGLKLDTKIDRLQPARF